MDIILLFLHQLIVTCPITKFPLLPKPTDFPSAFSNSSFIQLPYTAQDVHPTLQDLILQTCSCLQSLIWIIALTSQLGKPKVEDNTYRITAMIYV